MSNATVEKYILVLLKEVEILKGRLQEHDTGHLYTTINVLNERIKELNDQEEMPIDLDRHRNSVWDRQWAIENALKWVEFQKGHKLDLMDIADGMIEYIYKKD